MFQLIGFEGKGLGAVATKDIKRGTLILKELPQISIKRTNNRNQDINNLKSAFYRMNKINQEEYLSLYCYGFTSKEEKITKIFQFNKFTQRNFGMPNITEVLYIKGSRFNHSCCANAYFDWNSDKELEIRAMSKVIKAGQEITIDYHGMQFIFISKIVSV